MGPRVFWFKADDFGSVLLPEADLLRMVFFGVFWIWIGLRCWKVHLFRMYAGHIRRLHMQNAKRNDPTPTEICFVKSSKQLRCWADSMATSFHTMLSWMLVTRGSSGFWPWAYWRPCRMNPFWRMWGLPSLPWVAVWWCKSVGSIEKWGFLCWESLSNIPGFCG